MPERALAGTPAAPGVAVGSVWRADRAPNPEGAVPADQRERERDRAMAALAEAAVALVDLAAGRPREEAEIIAAGALMAQDPALLATVGESIRLNGLTAAQAILGATEKYAAAIAKLDDGTLAARAADVRSLGRRAARLTGGQEYEVPPGHEVVMIARDLGPADVAELATSLVGVVLADGGPTAHAAIVARSLGIPMVTGIDPQALEIRDGARVVVDGSTGRVMAKPSEESLHAAAADMRARAAAEQAAQEARDQPATTIDGRRITVMVNVATLEELHLGLRAGAEGIGLLRTELAFLETTCWPDEEAHARALRPILERTGELPAVVRVLDFGADKSPPFLRSAAARGIDLLLRHPEPFTWQLRAILLAGQGHDVRVLLPMVDTLEQLRGSRALIEAAARSVGIDSLPAIGPMIETPSAARNVRALAEESAFLSVGTNDLTATTLGAERFAHNTARSHHPMVLRSIADSVAAAHSAGIPIEVCGESASDPIMLPLLVGAGVDQLSVGAARLGEVRRSIRELDAGEAAGLFHSALTMEEPEEVEWAVRSSVIKLETRAPGDRPARSAAER